MYGSTLARNRGEQILLVIGVSIATISTYTVGAPVVQTPSQATMDVSKYGSAGNTHSLIDHSAWEKASPRSDNELCKDPKVDVLFNAHDNNTYAFKGTKYYKLTEHGVADGYPKYISDGWPGLPSDIDAAFTYKNGKTYFFKGTQYWRYLGRVMDGDYPKKISKGFTGIPDNIDAAMVWGGNEKIYFYKGNKFWRFDPLKRPPIKSTYPKPISNWEGLPNNLDAALEYPNGYTYFFKGDKYYRLNDRMFAVDRADPPFPRPSAYWWFGCKNVQSSTISTYTVGAPVVQTPSQATMDVSKYGSAGNTHSLIDHSAWEKASPRSDNELCKDPKVDVLFNAHDNNTYAFKGTKYYKLTENGVADGYPKYISDGWPGLPSDIDAAFTYKNGKTYFFKGTQYWRYSGRVMDVDFPKKISESFTGILDNLDAAMVWGGNGKIYFYRGSKFWRFDPLKRPPVKSTYPKPISNWEGLPNNLNAALQYTNGYTYFFKGDKYYRFNDRTFAVDRADPPFPRPSAYWWFGCKNVPSSFNSLGNVVADDKEDNVEHESYVDDLILDAGEWNRPDWDF